MGWFKASGGLNQSISPNPNQSKHPTTKKVENLLEAYFVIVDSTHQKLAAIGAGGGGWGVFVSTTHQNQALNKPYSKLNPN